MNLENKNHKKRLKNTGLWHKHYEEKPYVSQSEFV
jgi:hypothetical protein